MASAPGVVGKKKKSERLLEGGWDVARTNLLPVFALVVRDSTAEDVILHM